MKIQPIKSNYYSNTFQKRECRISKDSIPKEKGVLMTLTGIGVLGVLFVTAGMLSRNSFEKNIIKKGLELRNNILISKNTGEKYTGKIRSNVGKLGFNKKETCEYVDGVLSEKTYRNLFGLETKGVFYKDGKECVNVKVSYPYLLPWHKHTDTYWLSENGVGFIHMEGRRSGSAFESARKRVKDFGWYNPNKHF